MDLTGKFFSSSQSRILLYHMVDLVISMQTLQERLEEFRALRKSRCCLDFHSLLDALNSKNFIRNSFYGKYSYVAKE